MNLGGKVTAGTSGPVRESGVREAALSEGVGEVGDPPMMVFGFACFTSSRACSVAFSLVKIFQKEYMIHGRNEIAHDPLRSCNDWF